MKKIQLRLETLPRGHDFAARVEHVYCRPQHVKRARHTYRTLDYYYILEGSGACVVNGRTYPLSGNSAFATTPGMTAEIYSHGEWLALTLVYKNEVVDYLKGTPVWPRRVAWEVRDMANARRLAETIVDYCGSVESPGTVDVIDFLCYALMTECSRRRTPAKRKLDIAIEKIVKRVEKEYRQTIDFNDLIAEHDISRSHFFRRWKERVSMSPGEYVHYLRVRDARDLLENTDRRIGEIAETLGYEDPFYFTFKFTKSMGLAPREYRKLQQSALKEA